MSLAFLFIFISCNRILSFKFVTRTHSRITAGSLRVSQSDDYLNSLSNPKGPNPADEEWEVSCSPYDADGGLEAYLEMAAEKRAADAKVTQALALDEDDEDCEAKCSPFDDDGGIGAYLIKGSETNNNNIQKLGQKRILEAVLISPALVDTHKKDSQFDTMSAHDVPEGKAKWEVEQVKKGLTHIKYNKFAPSPEVAAKMTDEEFRAYIYLRMKEEEKKRRADGRVGNAVSDDYLNGLGGSKSTTQPPSKWGKMKPLGQTPK